MNSFPNMEEAQYQKKSLQFTNLKSYTTTVFLFMYVIYGANKHIIKLDIIYLGILFAAIINLGLSFYMLRLNSALRDINYSKNTWRIMAAIVFNGLMIFLAYYS